MCVIPFLCTEPHRHSEEGTEERVLGCEAHPFEVLSTESAYKFAAQGLYCGLRPGALRRHTQCRPRGLRSDPQVPVRGRLACSQRGGVWCKGGRALPEEEAEMPMSGPLTGIPHLATPGDHQKPPDEVVSETKKNDSSGAVRKSNNMEWAPSRRADAASKGQLGN
jgi:hypothetical protein